ncbi:MAG: carboxylating nicotinate-nucleotide diphosphorylase [Chthonomonas sp.]|nr:carboxylating nicotinate-nucleotide diphosphorylase [Chthonomonas sp.]
MNIPQHLVDEAISRALAEDFGLAGDLTSQATIPADQRGTAVLLAKEAGVVSGLEVAAQVFAKLHSTATIKVLAHDGDPVAARTDLLSITGSVRALLGAERTALNFARHMSGVATATARMVELVAGTKTQIVCTRKTTPGLRAFEKYAVTCGGGHNHRFGLFDAILIKDNHIAACGGVAAAIRAARNHAGHLVKIEVEVDSMAKLDEALAEGPDVIMLDNMSPDEVRVAIARIAGRARTEASGGITSETVRAYAEAGVDLISVGWITHSAPNLDLSLDFRAGPSV